MGADLRDTIDAAAALGKKSPYPTHYDKTLLFAVERDLQRKAMKFPKHFVFQGYDVWNAYEIMCHNLLGKPMRCSASFVVSAQSKNLFESKSAKLYLHSLNHERFSSLDVLAEVVRRDLSEISESSVKVILENSLCAEKVDFKLAHFRCIDGLNIEVNHYRRAPELLKVDSDTAVKEKVCSHLFKSHCLCTGQPDIGSIFIDYEGPKIQDEGLLAYLISYSQHVGFSENCVEQIFVDLMEKTRPFKLTVFGRFTRRGGIDINPYRSTHTIPFDNTRLYYQ